jgi:hypothetical protein
LEKLERSMAKTQKLPLFGIAAAAAMAFILAACGGDCNDAASKGDFEYTQGNLENAARHYERALKLDSTCGDGRVRERLTKIKDGTVPR